MLVGALETAIPVQVSRLSHKAPSAQAAIPPALVRVRSAEELWANARQGYS